jgi:spermidine synthase
MQLQEQLYAGYGQVFEVEQMLTDRRSAFQHIQLFRTKCHGIVLMLDGVVQFTALDEHVYSEMMAHPALFAHGAPRRVLIVGGGDGCVLREVLKHPSVEEVVVCEIDPDMIALARSELAEINAGAFENPRVVVAMEDAAEFVRRDANRGRFDLIATDRPDPAGPGVSLFSESFYAACRGALSERGVLVLQSGVPIYQRNELVQDAHNLTSTFAYSGFAFVPVPTYIGGFMALGWGAGWAFGPSGGRPVEVAPAEIAARFERAGIDTSYYWPGIHAACFAGPRALMELVRV